MARDRLLTFRLDQLSQTAMAKALQVCKKRIGLNIRELRVLRAIGAASTSCVAGPPPDPKADFRRHRGHG